MSNAPRPRIAMTLGDPAGVGPEVALKALADPQVRDLADFVVFGPAPDQWAELAGQTPTFLTGSHSSDAWAGPAPTGPGKDASAVRVEGVQLIHGPADDLAGIPPGCPSQAGGEASVRYLLGAIEAAKQGRVDAIVTGPISKEAIRMAGYLWPGHTEMFAEKFGAAEVAMMFAGGPFRVVLVTIHMALVDAIHALTVGQILKACRLGAEALRRWFAIPVPRLGVCGLNPHASEGGRFGFEEREIIAPAIEAAADLGIAAFGPLPPDTAFYQALKGKFDLVVAMYHDQGLIPIKTVAFEDSVNITLGLPVIRTSVDHGTAYDIAGRGQADPQSMKAAIRMAAEMVSRGRTS